MFRFRLFSPDGDDVGEFYVAESRWEVGDTFTTGEGRTFRIRAIVSEVDPDLTVQALWEVEPAWLARDLNVSEPAVGKALEHRGDGIKRESNRLSRK